MGFPKKKIFLGSEKVPKKKNAKVPKKISPRKFFWPKKIFFFFQNFLGGARSRNPESGVGTGIRRPPEKPVSQKVPRTPESGSGPQKVAADPESAETARNCQFSSRTPENWPPRVLVQLGGPRKPVSGPPPQKTPVRVAGRQKSGFLATPPQVATFGGSPALIDSDNFFFGAPLPRFRPPSWPPPVFLARTPFSGTRRDRFPARPPPMVWPFLGRGLQKTGPRTPSRYQFLA